jgi:hypothetical protein
VLRHKSTKHECRKAGFALAWVLGYILPSVECPANGQAPAARFSSTRLAIERIAPVHTSALIAAFRRDAPARGGAFADGRRIRGRRRKRSTKHAAKSGCWGSVAIGSWPTSRGFRSSIRFARLEIERITSFLRRRAHRRIPFRCIRAMRRVRR